MSETSRLSVTMIEDMMAEYESRFGDLDTHVFGRPSAIQRLTGLFPAPAESPLHTSASASLLGMKVVEDEDVPVDEIHFAQLKWVDGKLVKKVTKIFNIGVSAVR